MRDVTLPDSHRPNRGDVVELCSSWGCNMTWAKDISDVIPLCRYHFAMAHAAWRNYMDATAEPEKPDHERQVHWRTSDVGKPVVYYVLMYPHVKIGTTTLFPRRMKELYVQPTDYLAVEPGGRNIETSRHQQFASYRIKGTELFQRNAVLDELIAELVEKHGEPAAAADSIHFPPYEFEYVTAEVACGRVALGL